MPVKTIQERIEVPSHSIYYTPIFCVPEGFYACEIAVINYPYSKGFLLDGQVLPDWFPMKWTEGQVAQLRFHNEAGETSVEALVTIAAYTKEEIAFVATSGNIYLSGSTPLDRARRALRELGDALDEIERSR